MNPFQGKIGIIGAGAIGCDYGAKLVKAGNDVHFLMRRDYDSVSRGGLQIHSIHGDFHVQPQVHRTPESLGPCDLIIICLKATDNGALPDLLRAACGPQTLVFTLQNGLGNENVIADILANVAGDPAAAQRTLGGAAFICSTRGEPGVVNHTAEGWMHIAELQGASLPRTHAIAEMFRAAGVECVVQESLLQMRWEKLVWNVAFNGLGVAALCADTAIITADPTLRAAAIGLMREVLAAAQADGVSIPYEIIERRMDQTSKMGPYRTSMQIDYENHRPLEVEAILGEPVRRAQRANIAVPRMEVLYGIVKRASQLSESRTA